MASRRCPPRALRRRTHICAFCFLHSTFHKWLVDGSFSVGRKVCSLQHGRRLFLRFGYRGGWVLEAKQGLGKDLHGSEGLHLAGERFLSLLAFFSQQPALDSRLGLLERRN